MFNRRVILFSLILMTSALAHQPYWIFLDADTTQPEVVLSPKTVKRMIERGTSSTRGTHRVSPTQVIHLQDAGVKIRHVSRFLNAVSVEIEGSEQLLALQKFSFVRAIKPVANLSCTLPEVNQIDLQLHRRSDLVYGQSLIQNELLQIPVIHGCGYDATGIVIGVFDAGFNLDHPAFDDIDIIGQYDFVDHEFDVQGVGQEHGVNTLGILGGYFPGELIGAAYSASFLLARTEDGNTESRTEEDNWVAALEWADSLGVDIISTSLNYRLEHDDPAEDYPDSTIDGETAVITRAANIAVERGILVVNSAANEGRSGSGTIWPPADSPHVLAVGAINAEGKIASWSSRGPTYDGRIKPDVVAMGVSVYIASGVNSFRHGDGTSFSAPQVAGLAALLLQAYPTLTPDSVISLFQKNSNRALYPDNNYGYGLPDLRRFFQATPAGRSSTCLIYPNPTSSGIVNLVLKDRITNRVNMIQLFDIRGQQMEMLDFRVISDTIIEITLPVNRIFANQLFLIQAATGDRNYTGKLILLK